MILISVSSKFNYTWNQRFLFLKVGTCCLSFFSCPCQRGLSGATKGSASICNKPQLPKFTIRIKDFRRQFIQCGCTHCLHSLQTYCPEYLSTHIKSKALQTSVDQTLTSVDRVSPEQISGDPQTDSLLMNSTGEQMSNIFGT